MGFIKEFISEKLYEKELASIAKIAASICFDDMMINQKKKSWNDVKDNVLSKQQLLISMLAYYRSHKDNYYNQLLIAFANSELLCCNNIIAKYQTP